MSSSDPECAQFLFVKVLANRGRLEAVTQQMGYHPQYLDSFLKMQHYLMHMDGPLPFDCRHYIAIMVSPAGSCGGERGSCPAPSGFLLSLHQTACVTGFSAEAKIMMTWRWGGGGCRVPGCLAWHGMGMLTCCSCRQLLGTSAGTW